jgi:hypothetical protein
MRLNRLSIVHVSRPGNDKVLWHNFRMSARVSRDTVLAAGALAAIVVYGAILRLDAVTHMYGPVRSPQWLQRLQHTRLGDSRLRPPAMTWAPVPTYPHADGPPTHYRSDPYTYLKYAREMRAFYAAHLREPLFPFTTKVSLWFFDDQDVAVSFASAAFSLVAIIATCLVGTLAFSRTVGLAAAFALAIEHELIGWNVGGWRDDAFTAAVMVCTYTMLKYCRSPSRANAAGVGMASGLACLIRITSLSFVAAGFAYLLLRHRTPARKRFSELGVAAAVGAAIVAPYLINCWRTFGDPLYAINFHTGAYRATEGQAAELKQTAGEYLEQRFRASPVRTIDTFILGMTAYPFSNKWRGFRPWGAWAGPSLEGAALVGLLFFIWSDSGRLLLVVLAGSMLPYAFTWRLLSDWRFTEHTYPFYLLAAGFAIREIVTMAVPSTLRARVTAFGRAKPAVIAAAVLATIAGVAWMVTRAFPPLMVKEALAAGENVSITAGDRDAAFFVGGWEKPVREGNVTTRAARGAYSTIDVPLPEAREYGITVRLDPHPRPAEGAELHLPVIAIHINNQRLASFPLTWNPQRVGAYDFDLPRALVKPGTNRVTFMSENGLGFKLWYLRVRPQIGTDAESR